MFPTKENREKFVAANRQNYLDSVTTNYPPSIQDAVQKLLTSIESVYESGHARIRSSVDVKTFEVTGLSFDVGQYLSRKPSNHSTEINLAKSIEDEFLSLLMPELDTQKVAFYGSTGSELLRDNTIWRFSIDLIVKESLSESAQRIADWQHTSPA